jgi:hypothetical protein
MKHLTETRIYGTLYYSTLDLSTTVCSEEEQWASNVINLFDRIFSRGRTTSIERTRRLWRMLTRRAHHTQITIDSRHTEEVFLDLQVNTSNGLERTHVALHGCN